MTEVAVSSRPPPNKITAGNLRGLGMHSCEWSSRHCNGHRANQLILLAQRHADRHHNPGVGGASPTTACKDSNTLPTFCVARFRMCGWVCAAAAAESHYQRTRTHSHTPVSPPQSTGQDQPPQVVGNESLDWTVTSRSLRSLLTGRL